MKNTIVIVTSGQPSLNPRLIKEADALSQAGYHVIVIYQYWNDWGSELDQKLKPHKKWEAIRVGGDPHKEIIAYLRSRIIHKIVQKVIKLFGFKNNFAELAIARSGYLLTQEAKSIKADLYIAHNLAALPAAVLASKKNNTKCGFDAEDFHRQEVSDDIHSIQYQLAKFIEDKYIPQLDYISCASPLIANAYQKNYPKFNPLVINNVFSNYFLQKQNYSTPNTPLKLFWFSQTIGIGRGLEDVIVAINNLKELEIELNLLGNITIEAQNYFNNLSSFKINYISPILGDDIFKLANAFDIGLALELNIPFNRDICLTNKIFTYLQAGLAVISSETAAQKKFFQENPNIGESYPIGNVVELAQIINTYYHNRNLLNITKQNALQLAETSYNWELESKKFINIIEETLKN